MMCLTHSSEDSISPSINDRLYSGSLWPQQIQRRPGKALQRSTKQISAIACKESFKCPTFLAAWVLFLKHRRAGLAHPCISRSLPAVEIRLCCLGQLPALELLQMPAWQRETAETGQCQSPAPNRCPETGQPEMSQAKQRSRVC